VVQLVYITQIIAFKLVFLVAIYSFAKETFNQAEIKEIIFSDLKINIKVDPAHELIIAFTNPLNTDNENGGTIKLDFTTIY